MSTSITPHVMRVGATTTVTVLLINHSSEVRTIETNQCGSLFTVTTTDGTVVGPAPRICAAVSLPRTLVPGGQYTFTDHWDGEAATGTPGAPSPLVGAGSYLVHGLPSWTTSVSLPASIELTP